MYLTKAREIRRVGFVSTRISGSDGVSLEIEKWAAVLERMGYECHYCAGVSDRPTARSTVVAEAFFGHPEIAALQALCFGRTHRDESTTGELHRLRLLIKKGLYDFVERFSIDLVIVENALAIPMNVALGLALTEFLAETGMPAIGHHHDFSWERQRFTMSGIEDIITSSFPPRVHSMNHVVINTEARQQLCFRRGLSSIVIPNVFDFEAPPPPLDDYARNLRADLGIGESDILLLQPTRIVARKGIEHAIELAGRLSSSMSDRKIRLLVSHPERDEGSDYFHRVIDYARYLEVDLVIAPERIARDRGIANDGRRVYSLADCYLNADFVTYPSSYEGFGNAFLEAVYYRKPILVNRYSIFESDIEPVGFKVALMDSFVTPEVIRHVRRLIEEAPLREEAVSANFELGRRYFSYALLEQRLRVAMMNFGVVG